MYWLYKFRIGFGCVGYFGYLVEVVGYLVVLEFLFWVSWGGLLSWREGGSR